LCGVGLGCVKLGRVPGMGAAGGRGGCVVLGGWGGGVCWLVLWVGVLGAWARRGWLCWCWVVVLCCLGWGVVVCWGGGCCVWFWGGGG